MAKRDYYNILGIDKSADKKQIKSAYRKMAKELHPDRNKAADAEEKFKEVQEAYEVLSDDQKRAAYDRFGHAGTSGFGGGGFNAGGFDFSGSGFDFGSAGGMDFGSIEDIFEQFFGGGFGGMRNRPRRGQDIGVRIQLSFKEAVFGVEKEISYKRGFPEEGEKSETMKVKVPGGIPDNAILRFQGKGHGGFNGGPPGDLLVNIEVEVDDRFERRGHDIYMDAEIDIYTAVLGGTLDVETVHGKTTLKVPAGIQSETVLRLKEKGGPKLRGNGNGDQYVRIIVKVPAKLSRQQRELWEQLAQLPDTKPGIIGRIFG
ncbi:MAG: Curved DNA-binding protein [candidate division WS6 bacterium OLB20]|uniref:Curved DNA-binding protein n=1 Tax=candidate division WS6 bacterium OLB20 TaxID=1617426 RepID=A0A136LZ63_9BACT|nr:MAG: Curved DNA-binding protein [candidate division WS6 bacterium OLB20]